MNAKEAIEAFVRRPGHCDKSGGKSQGAAPKAAADGAGRGGRSFPVPFPSFFRPAA